MLRFLLGIAVGMAAATAMQRKSESARRPAARGGVGRVDELSTAADHPPLDTGSLNAGDGTPSDRSTLARSDFPSPSGDVRNQNTERATPAMGQTSDSFNAA